MRSRSLVVAVLFTAACTGRFTVPPEPEGEGVQPLCGEIGDRLAITPDVATASAGQILVLRASGGTGNPRFRIGENPSGADVSSETGVYVAGNPDPALPSTVDLVILEDTNCRGDATASVTVLDGLLISPERIALRPGESVTFSAEGGSGMYTFSIADNGSGGNIDATTGRYTAGGSVGIDFVRLTDSMLGATSDATVEVTADADVVVATSEWVIPVGSTLDVPVTGGSDTYDVAITGGALELVADTTIRATGAGAGTVRFTDRFTGRSASINVVNVAPHDVPRRHPGDLSERHHWGGSGDFDGDGFVDAVLGMPDTSADWFEGGLVVIFRGDATGLDPTPARIIQGQSRDEEFGSAVTIGDLNGDGLDDLIIGSRRTDALRVNGGAVFIYDGVAGAFFSDAPTRTFFGNNSSDLFGSSLAVCDFNGDGRLDLAVGAPFAQVAIVGENDQGIISVFMPYEAGFVSTPDVTLLGQIPVAGVWEPLASLRLGETLAAGDFDNDGNCDLAAYARMPTMDQADSGVVALYRGVAEQVDAMGLVTSRGGLEDTPSLFWGRADGMDDDARFGLDLALADTNGDGRADLMASRYLHDGPDGSDTGAMYVQLGRDLSGPATSITDIAAGADWFVEGQSSARVGNGGILFDVNADGNADVVSGDSRAFIEDAELNRPGMIRVYNGGGGGPSATPSREYEGPVSDARFGLGVGAIPDADGDGLAELIAFAPYYDTVEGINDDRGAVFLQPSGGGPARELMVERTPSGQRVGFDVAWLGDLNGDGSPELGVTALWTDDDVLGRNVGSAWIFGGNTTGAQAMPSQTLASFTGHSSGDELGWQILGVGDFDGDGPLDVALLARSDDLPATLDPADYEVGAGCARRDNSSVVYIFRGQGDGNVGTTPAFAIFGPEANGRINRVLGDLDLDGDSLTDIVVGGRDWDRGGSNAGGIEIFLGRPAATDGRIVAICQGTSRIDGRAAGFRFGTSLAHLGDLDADGCDDFAVGSPEAEEDSVGGDRNEGEVSAYFGFGTMCATMSTRSARLIGANRDSQAGYRLAGGVDADGDSLADLLVGASRFRDGRGEVGRVMFVSGAYIVSLIGSSGPMIDPANGGNLSVDGSFQGERLGESIAMSRASGSAAVAVLGGPFGASSGVNDTGGLIVYQLGATGFSLAPRTRMSGETTGEGELGASVSATFRSGRLYIAVGAPYSSMVSGDDGASYAFAL